MAEKVLKIKTLSEVAEAISGLTDLSGSLKGVGTAAVEASGKAKAEWKGLEAEWSKSTATAKGVADQVFKVESALNAMGRAGSQSQLEAGLVKSKVAFDGLQAKIREVAATGGTLDDGVVASMNTMRAAIDAGKAKLNELKSSTEDARRSLGLLPESAGKAGSALGVVKDQAVGVSKGLMAASGAVGPFGEVLEKVGASGTGTTSKLAGLAFKAVGVGAAFKLGYDTGLKFDVFLKQHGVNVEKAWEPLVKLVIAERDENEVLTEKTKKLAGVIAARQAHQRQVTEAEATIKTVIAGWKSEAEAQRELGEKVANATKYFELMALAKKNAVPDIERNAEGIAKLADEIEKEKGSLDGLAPVFLAAIEQARKFLETNKAIAEGAAEAATGIDTLKTALEGLGKADVTTSIEAVAEALAKIRASGGDVGTAVAGNIEGLMKLRTAAEQNYETLAKFRTEVMDQIPAYQATAIASEQYAGSIEAIAAATADYEAKRRAANEADIAAGVAMAELEANAGRMAYSIETIGEAWMNATGHAAGFTVEVRRATKAVKETTPEFDAFIESLAVTSDEFERMVPYVGALIADLEKGKITPKEFGEMMDIMRVAFMQIQGVSGQMFGDIESLFNRLRELVNDFVHGENPRNKR